MEHLEISKQQLLQHKKLTDAAVSTAQATAAQVKADQDARNNDIFNLLSTPTSNGPSYNFNTGN